MWLEDWYICSSDLEWVDRSEGVEIPQWIQEMHNDIIIWVREDLGWLLERVKENFIRSQIRIHSWNIVLDQLIYEEISEQIYQTLLRANNYLQLDRYFIDETILVTLERLKQVNLLEYQEVKNNGGMIIIWNHEVNIQDYFLHDTIENSEISESLIDFIRQNWIPDSSSDILFTTISTGWIIAENISVEDWEIMLSNLQVFIEFIVQVESFWWQNIQNNQWSSAKWPFQYLDWFINWEPTLIPKIDDNWEIVKDDTWNTVMIRAFNRNEWDFSPFDTALRRTRRYYDSYWAEWVPDWVNKAWNNQPEFSPLNLSWEQSINLWIIDSFTRWNGVTDYLRDVVIHWHWQAMQDFYYNIHHTNPTNAVRRNVDRHLSSHLARLQPTKSLIYTRVRPRQRP